MIQIAMEVSDGTTREDTRTTELRHSTGDEFNGVDPNTSGSQVDVGSAQSKTVFV